jgi:leucyl-tRNA synthetase
MSKSTGNFLTLKEALEKFSADGNICMKIILYFL